MEALVAAIEPLAWPAWAFVCAYAPRVAAVAACRPTLGVGRAWLAAYALWPVLLGLGAGVSAALASAGLDELAPAFADAPWGLPLLAGAPMVVLVDALRGRRGRLATAMRAAAGRVRRLARARVPGAWVSGSDGGEGLSPRPPGWWFHVATDAERDVLAADPRLKAEVREALLDAGCPPHEAARMWFRFQSQESVDRDHAGDWWWALER